MFLLNLIFKENHMGLYFLFECKFIFKPMFPGVIFFVVVCFLKVELGSTGVNSTT